MKKEEMFDELELKSFLKIGNKFSEHVFCELIQSRDEELVRLKRKSRREFSNGKDIKTSTEGNEHMTWSQFMHSCAEEYVAGLILQNTFLDFISFEEGMAIIMRRKMEKEGYEAKEPIDKANYKYETVANEDGGEFDE